MTIFDWISKAVVWVGAFFASDGFIVAVVCLLIPYLLTATLLLRCHRPWETPSWRLWAPFVILIALGGLAGAAILLDVARVEGSLIWKVWFVIFALLVCVGPIWLAAKTGGRVKRAKAIVAARPGQAPVFEVTPPPLGDPPDKVTTGRRVVILCDGTSNRPDQLSEGIPAPTNVYRLYKSLVKSEEQTAWYDAGVGTETSSESLAGKTLGTIAKSVGWVKATPFFGAFVKFRTIIEAGFGVGITENIEQAYTEIVRQYRPGDRIYLLGFSRGAYTARCVAGVIRRCGLLRAENIRYSGDVVRLFRMRRQNDKNVAVDPRLVHDKLPAVEFLGLFDTVGSLGVPMWGWWFNSLGFFRNSPLSTDPSPICINVYHAMSMDERRAQFFPTPFDKTLAAGSWTTILEEVWFRGGHCDVGGGYADAGLSDIALEWMMANCMKHGLIFDPSLQKSLRPDPLARLHDELQRQPAWRLLGSWPRWHPVSGAELHPSVATRATAVEALGRHDMTVVGTTPVGFIAGAQREWDRTGLILSGGGARYKLTWKSGEWRDEECPSCGPAGQPGEFFWRWALRFRRRLPKRNYMTLCLTIAHPRPWPLREGSLGRLFHYLFFRDPWELRQQVAAVGRDLAKHGDSVVIQNNGGDGLMHVFANDAWMTAANNSGGLDMTIMRLPDDAPVTGRLWTFAPTYWSGTKKEGPREVRGWIPEGLQPWRWTRSAERL